MTRQGKTNILFLTPFYHLEYRWAGQLSDYWTRKVDVINRGYSGYNTNIALKIMKDVTCSLRPNVITIFFGANDAAVESSVQVLCYLCVYCMRVF